MNNPGRKQDFETFQGELYAQMACWLKLVEADPLGGPRVARLQPSRVRPCALRPERRRAERDGGGPAPGSAAASAAGLWQLARPRGDVLIVFTRPQAPACARLARRAAPPAARRRARSRKGERRGKRHPRPPRLPPPTHPADGALARSGPLLSRGAGARGTRGRLGRRTLYADDEDQSPAWGAGADFQGLSRRGAGRIRVGRVRRSTGIRWFRPPATAARTR